MGGQNSLSVALLAINAVLALPAIYILVRHGRSHFLGWLYLLVVCVLQVTGSALFLSDQHSSGAAIISNICLSPLLLAILGILHELRAPYGDQPRRRFDTVFTTFLHLHIAAAIGLVAAGASDLASSHPKESSETLVKVGIILLLTAWVMILLWALSLFVALRRAAQTNKVRTAALGQNQDNKLNLYAVLLALIITGIRLAYTLSTIFDSGSLDPASHSLALEVVLSALPEIVAVIILLAVGFRILSQRKR